jgi:3-oxoacyl-(acyl-carrier-protein) synthase
MSAITVNPATDRAVTVAVGIAAAVPSDALPADLRAAAKAAGVPRQVVRFLDGMALPAFVAGLTALDAAGVTEPADGERCGLFTVSGWDPDQHQPDLGGEPASYETVARHYITTASPMSWLRKMVNNVLCQLAMTRNLRGPNNHVVGGSDALAAVLALGRRAVARGTADQVLVVAYDAPAGDESTPDPAGAAAALVLTGAASARPLPTLPAFPAEAGAADVRAVDTLDALIREPGTSAAPGAGREG